MRNLINHEVLEVSGGSECKVSFFGNGYSANGDADFNRDCANHANHRSWHWTAFAAVVVGVPATAAASIAAVALLPTGALAAGATAITTAVSRVLTKPKTEIPNDENSYENKIS